MGIFWKDRIKEPSTWRGLAMLGTGTAALFGIAISPEQTEAVIAAGMAVTGAIGAFSKG